MDKTQTKTGTTPAKATSNEFYRHDGNKIIHGIVQTKDGIVLDNTKGHPLGSVVAMVLVPKDKYDSMEKKIRDLELRNAVLHEQLVESSKPHNSLETPPAEPEPFVTGEVYDEKEVLELIESSKQSEPVEPAQSPAIKSTESPAKEGITCPNCKATFKSQKTKRNLSAIKNSTGLGKTKKVSKTKPY